MFQLHFVVDKDLSEIENFELGQAMNILKDIQQSGKKDEENGGSQLMSEIKRLSGSSQGSPILPRKPKESTTFQGGKGHKEEKQHSLHTKGHVPPSPLKSPSSNKKSTSKILKEKELVEKGHEPQQPNSPSLSKRPVSQSSATDSERSYLYLHREKRAHKQHSEPDQINQSTRNSNIPVKVSTNKKPTSEKHLPMRNKKINRIFYHLMLRPSEGEHKFCNIVDALSYEMKKKEMKSVLIQYLHQNPPKFSVST